MDYSIAYGRQTISFSVQWRNRKTLAIEVYPDLSVNVVAPLKASIEEIKEKVLKRARWILLQWNYFDQFLPRTPEREYVSGESHLYLGKKYILKIRQSEKDSVKLRGGNFEVFVRNPSNVSRVKQLMASWYKLNATRKFDQAFTSSLDNFDLGHIPEFRIQRMKNRWGSCSANGLISLNPEIIKAPTKCIEYVILHELCHLIHSDHSPKFYLLLDRVQPDWRRWKLRLEKSTI